MLTSYIVVHCWKMNDNVLPPHIVKRDVRISNWKIYGRAVGAAEQLND